MLAADTELVQCSLHECKQHQFATHLHVLWST